MTGRARFGDLSFLILAPICGLQWLQGRYLLLLLDEASVTHISDALINVAMMTSWGPLFLPGSPKAFAILFSACS